MKKGVGDDPFSDQEPGDSVEETKETQPDMSQSAQIEPEPEETTVEKIVEAFEEIEAGRESKGVSFRDTSMKALLVALEQDETTRNALLGDLDLSPDADRSEIVRTLIRAGLESEASGTYELLAEARAEHARDGV